MLPAQPPLPSCVYFPFHPAAGSQTANLISESEVGRMMPVTSQRAGASATANDEVIVVYGNFRPTSFSQDCCAKAGDARIVIAGPRIAADQTVRLNIIVSFIIGFALLEAAR